MLDPADCKSSSFWLRLGAQGVTLSVCPSVRAKVLILLISGSYLQADFKVTSG